LPNIWNVKMGDKADANLAKPFQRGKKTKHSHNNINNRKIHFELVICIETIGRQSVTFYIYFDDSGRQNI